MKKISFLTKIVFHIYNILLILMYIYPGSVMGWIVYRDIQKQPQLSNDFTLFSSNHVYAFLVLSLLGLFSHYKNNIKFLFLYLLIISIFLELCHFFIPQRSFQFQDLFGNILGVFLVFLVFYTYQFIRGKISDY